MSHARALRSSAEIIAKSLDFYTFEKLRGGYAERSCELADVHKGHVPFSTLQPTDVVAVESSFFG